jgi:hypothetical protein
MENPSTKVELLLEKVDQLNEEEFGKMVDSLTTVLKIFSSIFN